MTKETVKQKVNDLKNQGLKTKQVFDAIIAQDIKTTFKSVKWYYYHEKKSKTRLASENIKAIN